MCILCGITGKYNGLIMNTLDYLRNQLGDTIPVVQVPIDSTPEATPEDDPDV